MVCWSKLLTNDIVKSIDCKIKVPHTNTEIYILEHSEYSIKVFIKINIHLQKDAQVIYISS